MEPAFQLGTRSIGKGHPAYVIAEVGINHEGDAEVCALMIEAAAKAGADAVKLQIIDAAESYAPGTESHRLFSQAWLPPETVSRMFDLARERGVAVFATVGDRATLEWVERLDPVAHKISSGLLTHLPLIEACASTGRPLIISAGMSIPADVDEAIESARHAGAEALSLLHCTSIYPAPVETWHLAAIPALAARTGLPVGYSDHSDGVEAPAFAALLGAVIIEKHFTLDRSRPGFDHPVSLDAAGFRRMIEAIRRAEAARGVEDKIMSDEEALIAHRSRRMLAARRAIPAGHVLTENDIGFIRLLPDAPRAYEPKDLRRLLGAKTRVAIKPYQAFLAEHLEAGA